MGFLYIGLLLAGLLCFIVSFFLSEKLSSSDVNEFEKMSKSDMNAIVERQLREADDNIKKMIADGMEDAMDEFEVKADKLLNDKILSISDYSDSVLTSIEKSHKEIIFMYDMLTEKQEILTELTKNIQKLESNLREIKANIEESANNGDFRLITDELEEIEKVHVLEEIIEEAGDNKIETALDNKVKFTKNSKEENNQNDKILKMYKEGYSEVEIAKSLGRGLGEIKLVLGLFNN